MTKCSYCQAEIPEGAAACGSCGRSSTELQAGGLRPTVPYSGGLVGAAVDLPEQAEEECGCGGEPVFEEGTLLADRYRIIRRLGAGGMGTVYRAWDRKLDQDVALKFVSGPCGTSQEEGCPVMLNEVRFARRVTHPNVCRVYDLGEIRGCLFLSMEYVDGEDLASLLRRTPRLPPDRADRIARQLCEGLLAAHEQAVLHRDIKPRNILIDRDGSVRITDFGLAKAVQDQQKGTAGTPGYMAPELFGGAPANVQTDLYSLGVVLYELYSGEPLFRGVSVADLLRNQSRPVPHLLERAPTIDAGVEDAILRCLDWDPSKRPRSVRVLLAALEGHRVEQE